MSTSFAFKPIVTDGLILNLDAANRKSFVSGSTSWYDLSGRGNTGTLTNGPTYNGVNAGSIVFDGTNQYVTCGNPSALQLIGALTLSVWVKTSASSYALINKSKGIFGSPSDKIYELGAYQNILYFQFGNGTTNDSLSYSASTISDNRWHNVISTWDGTTSVGGIKIYYDGNIVKSGTATITSIQNFASNLLIGWGNRTDLVNYLNGTISNVQIYNRALSATEVLQNYNALKNRYI